MKKIIERKKRREKFRAVGANNRSRMSNDNFSKARSTDTVLYMFEA